MCLLCLLCLRVASPNRYRTSYISDSLTERREWIIGPNTKPLNSLLLIVLVYLTMAQTPRQLLNTSWTLHRLSPLHHGKEYQSLLDNPTALNTYATRLRDQLTGDILSGLQAGLGGGGGGGGGGAAAEDDTLSKTGALKSCTWEGIERFDEGFTAEAGGQRGILIALEYENTTYKATLLAGPDNDTPERKGVTILPLLLTRLPTALRQTFISFLSATFDTYCSQLRLSSTFMCAGLDMYVNTFLSSGSRDGLDDATDILQNVVKDMQLTLSFSPSIAPALRSLNVNIPRASFGEFLRGSNSDGSSSFLSALSTYLEKHLAMNLDLSVRASGNGPGNSLAKQHVRVSKIACGGFVLGSEGRMKLSADLGRQSGAGTGTGTGDDAGDGQNSRVLNEKDRLELRASHALLLGVLRRAVAGEAQMK